MDAIAGLLVVAMIVTTIVGVMCLINPKMVMLSSRWQSVPLLTSIILVAGLLLVIESNSDAKSSADEARIAGTVIALIWLGGALLCWKLARRQPLVAADPVAAQSDEMPGLFERMASAYGRAVQEARERQALNRERQAQERKERERLREQQAIQDRIAAEREFNRQRAATARAPVPAAPRVTRTPKARPKAQPAKVNYDPDRPDEDHGGKIEFEYVDAQGEITDREIVNWAIEGDYLTGFCMDQRAVRTFRLDRVTEWRNSA